MLFEPLCVCFDDSYDVYHIPVRDFAMIYDSIFIKQVH